MSAADGTLIAAPGALVPGDGANSQKFLTQPLKDVWADALSTVYSNQRKIDKCQNGVMWAFVNNMGASNSVLDTYYSTDGESWTASSPVLNASGSSTATYSRNSSIFIDVDDYAHVVFKDNGNGYVYYRRGTPNTERTSWTWSAATIVGSSTGYDYADIVAHREGTGWAVHIVASFDNGASRFTRYWRLPIASDGTFSSDIAAGWTSLQGLQSAHSYPSIDFNHTGDGKTVAGGTPHLYVAWSAGATGSGYGIRFKKATYSGGTWTWGTEREIDPNYRVTTHLFQWLTSFFDGTRVVIAGNGEGGGVYNSFIYDRNAADTATTQQWLQTNTDAQEIAPFGAAVAYDSSGDLHFFSVGNADDVVYYKWTRTTQSFSKPIPIAPYGQNALGFPTTVRGAATSRLDCLYLGGFGDLTRVAHATRPLAPSMPSITSLGDVASTGAVTSVVTGGWTNEAVIADSTAYSNQRKIDRTSDGVLWSSVQQGSPDSIFFHYSTDGGRTWNLSTGTPIGIRSSGTAFAGNWSFFIDQDDYAHVVYKQMSNGYIYYTRGTLNANRDTWTWSAATLIYDSSTSADYPDVVVHREGSGWAVHIVWSTNTSTPQNIAWYNKAVVSSGGSITYSAISPTMLGIHTVNTPTFPSIDFNHTGDGKTVAGGTPHVYVAWSAGATGAGKGVRFRKATYSGGSWTWGAEQEIDSTRYIYSNLYWLNCLFDGTRVLIGGWLYNASQQKSIILHERDVADTTTTTRVLITNTGDTNNALAAGSMSYDDVGSVYFGGTDASSVFGPKGMRIRKWVRTSPTAGYLQGKYPDIDSGFSNGYVSLKRGYSGSCIEYVYTDDTGSSPHSVVFGSVPSAAPSVPSITSLEDPNLWDRVNLVTNPSFEIGTAGWISQVGSPDFTISSAQSSSGTYSLMMIATAGSQATGGMALTMDIPVMPGRTYRFQYKSRAGTVGRSCQPWVFWLDSAGASYDLVMGTGTTNNSAAWALASTGAITAPAVAAYARIYIRIGGTGGTSPVAGEVHYFDDVLFEQSSALGTYFDGGTTAVGKQYGWFTDSYGRTVSGEESLLQVESGSAGFSGSGSLGLTPRPGFARSGALSGSGTLTVPTRTPKPIQAASLSGSGTLSVPTRTPTFYTPLNILPPGNRDGSGWTAGGTVITTGVADPEGGNAAFRVDFTSGQVYAAAPTANAATGLKPWTVYEFSVLVKPDDPGVPVSFNLSLEDFSGTGGSTAVVDGGDGLGGYPEVTVSGSQYVRLTRRFRTGSDASLKFLFYSISGVAAGKRILAYAPAWVEIGAALSLSGSGSLATVGVGRPIQTVQLSGSGALGLARGPFRLIQSAGLSGAGTLALTPVRVTVSRTQALSGSGTLSFVPVVGFARSGVLSGSGTLTIPTLIPRPTQTGALSGTGVLTFTNWFLFTASAYGGTATGTGWVNPSNATGADNGSYATWTTATADAVSEPLIVSNFGTWSNLPPDATIPKITVRVKGYTSSE